MKANYQVTPEAEKILIERFGKDSILALATTEDNIPYVRSVDAYYENGVFYVLTHALSGKMRQLAKNPVCALAGEWFTAHGVGESMGWFRKPENAPVAAALRQVFAEWIDNGHNNLDDPNCIILKIRLTQGVLFSHGTCYNIDFAERA